MKFSRRDFLISTLMSVGSPALLAKAGARDCPIGILDSFQWGERTILVSESALPSNSALDRAVADAMRHYRIVGCGICVVRRESIVYAKGFGCAELPITPLRFQIGTTPTSPMWT